MTRSSYLGAAILAASFASACDNDATDMQADADKARQDASAKIAETRAEANQDIREVRADADLKVADAEAKFATLRENYRHDATIRMVDLDKKIADVKARHAKATGSQRTELDVKLQSINAQHDVYMGHYNALDKETAVTWDTTRARLDAEWAELVSRVNAA